VISTLTLAPITQAQDIAANGVAAGSMSVDTGGLDSAAFMSLHAQALRIDWEPLLPLYDPVASASANGPWVFVIPEQLRSHLARLDEQSARDLATLWAECQELQDDGVSREEAHEILLGVVSAARHGGPLLLWLSL
jgi:hypothetical protein